jgi:hypothetical protein
MINHIFKKWEPVSDIPEKLFLEALHDDYEGFRLLFKGKSNNDKTLRVTFKTTLVYRNIDEGDIVETLKNSDGLSHWCLYTLENSDLIEFFHKQNYGSYKSSKILHYAFYTPNDCVEILSEFPPQVEWLN